MQSSGGYEYLSFGDALFLFLERPVTPLHISATGIFKGEITREELVRFMETKLPRLPRFRQKVVASPMNVALPHWEPDPDFNLEDHIRETRLRRGTEKELQAAVAAILSPAMDRSKPLWDLTLIHGVRPANTAVVIRAHHSMVDGVAGVGLLSLLLDTTSSKRLLRAPKKHDQEVAPPDSLSMLACDVLQSCLGTLGRALSIQRDLFAMAQQSISEKEPGQHGEASERTSEQDDRQKQMDKVLPELGAPAIRFPFNRVCQGPQRFVWAEIPFERIRSVKHKLGVTVNDVMLTIVSCAYRDYAELHGKKIRHPIRMVIPVNTRRGDGSAALGNQITFAPVNVPLAVREPLELLHEVRRRTQAMKTVGLAELVSLGGSVLGLVPPPLQAALASLICQLPISLCNVIFTNVPGPLQPLYLNGHEMLKCYPYVPIGGEMAINCAALTYNGTAYFGFSGDAQVSEELEQISRSLVANFEHLAKSLHLSQKPAVRKSKTRAKTVVQKAVPRGEAAPIEREVEPITSTLIEEKKSFAAVSA